MWDEITYPFQIWGKGHVVSSDTLQGMCFTLIYVSKMGPWWRQSLKLPSCILTRDEVSWRYGLLLVTTATVTCPSVYNGNDMQFCSGQWFCRSYQLHYNWIIQPSPNVHWHFKVQSSRQIEGTTKRRSGFMRILMMRLGANRSVSVKPSFWSAKVNF